MQEDTQQKLGSSHPFQLQAPEAMAAFSAAALLTLALISPPLNLAGKVSACIFSIALPVLVAARVFMALSEDEAQNSAGKVFSQRLRFGGYTFAIVGLVPFLIELYWIASLAFIFTIFALLIAYVWVVHKVRIGQEILKQNGAPLQQTAASANSETLDGKK
jgi:hypothetical protein